MQRRVRDLIQQKGLRRVPKIEAGATIETALIKLEHYNSGALIVMNAQKVAGIFTERDFARASIKEGKVFNLNSKVNEVMSTHVAFVTEDYQLDECMAIMSRLKIRHLPVMREEEVVSLLSMRHIMEALVEDKDFMINELTRYVTGSNYFREPHPKGFSELSSSGHSL